MYYALILALVWGVFWAGVLEYVPLGRFLALRRTWLTVVIGVGIDVLIMLTVLDPGAVAAVLAVLAASSAGIIARSIANEWREEHALMEVVNGKQDPRRE